MVLVKFDIPPRSRRCHSGQEEFIQGVEYMSLLEEVNEESFSRKDFCLPCWKKLFQEGETLILGHVHWRSSVPVKITSSQTALRRNEMALQLLRVMVENEVSENASEAFVLALLLARSKKLQLRQEIFREDRSILLFEVIGTEEMIGIPKVNLSTIETEKVQRTLAHKFSEGFSLETKTDLIPIKRSL